MIIKPLSRIGIFLITSFTLALALAHATAVYENSTLTLPYVVYGEALYRVDLTFMPHGEVVEFVLGPASQYGAGTTAPDNAATRCPARPKAAPSSQRASKPMASNIGII